MAVACNTRGEVKALIDGEIEAALAELKADLRRYRAGSKQRLRQRQGDQGGGRS